MPLSASEYLAGAPGSLRFEAVPPLDHAVIFDPDEPPVPAQLQLVLDLRVLGQVHVAAHEAAPDARASEARAHLIEARLAISLAARGDLVRAIGWLRLEMDASGTARWEV